MQNLCKIQTSVWCLESGGFIISPPIQFSLEEGVRLHHSIYVPLNLFWLKFEIFYAHLEVTLEV